MPSNFLEALAKASRPIIMEIKPRDGHGRDLLRGRDLREIVQLYEAAGAPCLSVVTGHWFGGGSAMLKEVAGQTGLPLLCKDFFTRADQIARARQAGASAILLTAGILPKPLLRHLIEACFREGMTPFVEIADACDLDGLKLAGCAVAVNNKDIAKRERGPTALERSVALLLAVQGSGAACPVSASGIATPEIAARLLDAGFKALLVGSALLDTDDVAGWSAAVDRHRRPPLQTAGATFLAVCSGHASSRPRATALLWRGERIGYGELHDSACTLAAYIRSLMLPESQPVGILAKKSPRAVALIIGCLMAGRRVVLPSPSLPESALKALFDQAGCSRILTPDDVFDAAPALRGDRIVERVFSGPDETGFILTTSGSTGLPKLVPLPMPVVDSFADWACTAFGIGPGTMVMNHAPLHFDLCLLDIWATLKGGGGVALADQDLAANGWHLCELLATSEAEVVQAAPMFYRLLIDAALPSRRRFDRVRHVIFTGDHMPPACLDSLPALFPAARFYNIYGCAETNDSFIHELGRPPLASCPVPIGRPLPGVEFLIVDEADEIVEGGGVGELLVSTPFQTEGYLGAVDNEGKFVHRKDGASIRRYFRSGDLVRRHDDGSITLKGRKDFVIKIRGVQVNTQEVEHALLDHDGVLEGAVVALADPLAGHRLHAVVRRQPGCRVNSLELFQHCADRLPRSAIPSTIVVNDAALPRTSTGKIDRRQISQNFMNGETP